MKSKDLRYFTLPNIVTLLGLLSGSIAVFYAINNPDKLYMASYFVGFALVFDFLDGFTARLLKLKSEIGKQLDSLADLVNFGVAPAIITFQLLKVSLKVKAFSFDLPVEQIFMLLAPTVLILFAALRLAKFNVDTRQTSSFIGLPTPAMATFFAAMPLVKDFDPGTLLILYEWLDIFPFAWEMKIIGLEVFVMESVWFYLPLVLIFAVLMIVGMPMFSLKFESLNFKKNAVRFSFLIASFFLIAAFQVLAIPLVIFLYIFMSVGFAIKQSPLQKKQHIIEEDSHLNDGLHLALSIPELNMYSAEIQILPMSEIIQKRNEEILKEIRSEYKDFMTDVRTGNYLTMRVEAESEEVARMRVGEVCANILVKHGLKDVQYNIRKACM